jgi:hypothetical protein
VVRAMAFGTSARAAFSALLPLGGRAFLYVERWIDVLATMWASGARKSCQSTP